MIFNAQAILDAAARLIDPVSKGIKAWWEGDENTLVNNGFQDLPSPAKILNDLKISAALQNRTYGSYAAASTAAALASGTAGAIADQTIIQVYPDETQNNYRSLYQVQNGALVLLIVIDSDHLRDDLSSASGSGRVGHQDAGNGSIERLLSDKLSESIGIADFPTLAAAFAGRPGRAIRAPNTTINLVADVVVESYFALVGEHAVTTTLTGAGALILSGSQRSVLNHLGWSGCSGTAALRIIENAHMTAIWDLLFRSCSCPAIVCDNSWDWDAYDIDILECGLAGAGDGQPLQFINSTNNVHITGCRHDGMIAGTGLLDSALEIYINGGKSDGGFGAASDRPVWIVRNNSSLWLADYYFGGTGSQKISVSGQSSLTCDHVVFDGGDPFVHILLDGTPAQQLGGGISGADIGPIAARVDLGFCVAKAAHPSVETVAIALIHGTMTDTPIVSGITISAVGSFDGTATTILISPAPTTNSTYKRCYLVNSQTGNTSRYFILDSFAGGNIRLQGDQTAVNFSGIWQIELLATRALRVCMQSCTLAQGLAVFELINTLTVTVIGGWTADSGLFLFAANWATTAACTNYDIYNPRTGWYYRCVSAFAPASAGAAGNLFIAYDASGEINVGDVLEVRAGRTLNPLIEGEHVTWFTGSSSGPVKRQMRIEDLQATGRSIDEIMERIDGVAA